MSDFSATHVVPSDGLSTWPNPDMTQPEGPRLDPGLPVQLAEQRGAWGRVMCSNGWEAWVDVNRLVPNAPPHAYGTQPLAPAPGGYGGPQPMQQPYGAPPVTGGPGGYGYPPPPGMGYQQPPGQQGWRGMQRGGGQGMGGVRPQWGPIISAVIILVAPFLTWFGYRGVDFSAMRISAEFLFNHRTPNGSAGFAIGYLVIVAAVLVLAGSVIPNASWVARAGGILAMVIAADFVFQTNRINNFPGHPSLFSLIGVGVYLSFFSGLSALTSIRKRR